MAGLTLPIVLSADSEDAVPDPSPASAPPADTTASTTVASPATSIPDDAAAPLADVPDGPVTIVGESLTLSAADALEARLGEVVIDAEVGRSFEADIVALEGLADTGDVGPVVVVHVGNNDGAPEDGFERIRDLTGESRLIVLTVSVPREWESQVNAAIERFAASEPDVEILDWKAVTVDEPEVLAGDRIHLSETGIERYADLIADTVHGIRPPDSDVEAEVSTS